MNAVPIFFIVLIIIPIVDTIECHSLFYYDDRTYKDTVIFIILDT